MNKNSIFRSFFLFIIVALACQNLTFASVNTIKQDEERAMDQKNRLKRYSNASPSTHQPPAKQMKLFDYFNKDESKEEIDNASLEIKPVLLAPMKHPILAGFGYTKEGPYLIVDDIGQSPTARNTIPIWNQSFVFAVEQQRFCIGRYDISTFESFPCDKQATLKSQYNHCYSCNKSLEFNPAFYLSPESISEKQKKYNLNPHNVYLAYFTKDIIKVGIANAQRTERRLLEQGALAALLLKSYNNAYEAREIEARIVKDYKFKESVTANLKKKFLSTEYNSERAFEVLKRAKAPLSVPLKLDHDNQFFNLQPQFYQSEGVWKGLPINDHTFDLVPKVSGQGIGLIGDTLIIQTKQNVNIYSLNKLLGRVISRIK